MLSLHNLTSRFFAGVRIRTKLLLGFSAVLSLLLLLSVFTYFSVQSIETTLLPARSIVREISNSVLQMRLQARLFLSDTIVNGTNLEFFENGSSPYLTNFEAYYQEFSAHIQMLKKYGRSIGVDNQTHLDALDVEIAEYRSTFLQMVEIYEQIGSENYGLQGKMREIAQELEAQYQDQPNQLVTLLQARRQEKNFFLRKDVAYADLFDAEIAALKKNTANPATQELITSYSQLFHQIVALQTQLGSESGEGLHHKLVATGDAFEQHLGPEEELVLSKIDSTIRWSRFLVVIVTTVLILMGLGLAVVIANAIVQPLSEVKTAAEEIAGGNFSKRLTIFSHDEIAELSVVFNSMAERLGNTLQTVESKNQALSVSVNENEKAQRATLNILEDLDLAKRRAEEGQAKDDAILASIGDGVVVTDQTGQILFTNQATLQLIGWTSAELVGKHWVDDVPKTVDNTGAEIPKTERALYKALSTGTKTTVSYQYVKKDGSLLPVSVTASPVILNNQVIGGIVVFRDITKEHEVDRMKTEFISLASHQLRTPLTAMKWFSEMLLAGDSGPLNPEQTEFIKNISDSNERMIELVNGLLNISRIESGRLIVEPVPSNLNALVDEVLVEIKPRMAAKNQKLIFSHLDSLPEISVDQKLIRQVYSNLLTNALKYTPEGGEISIFLSKNEDAIVSQVSDTGYGIPKAEQSKVFAKFYRGTNITPIETDGTGLGLYLIKSVIESSGGKIWFTSEEGKGTSFFFSLPLSGMKAHKGEVRMSE